MEEQSQVLQVTVALASKKLRHIRKALNQGKTLSQMFIPVTEDTVRT